MIKSAAALSKKVSDKVQCLACARRCIIPNGGHGFCYVRQNINGELKLADYGVIDAMQVDPIEKKPFNHFMPGSYVLGVGTSSCNFGCMFCQNHNISKENGIVGSYVSPNKLVDLALKHSANGIAFTYNEPTIFIEYALDVAKLAHEKGLFSVFVSNGYMTKEAIALMKGSIDAVVVDFKGNAERVFTNKFMAVYSSDPIKDALVELKRVGIHIEITDLVVPKVGDSLIAATELTEWIANNLGHDVPLHFTRFHPDYKMDYLPDTPVKTLEEHYKVAKRAGLDYVYIGNVPGNKYEDTYCPKCNAVVIEREGFYIKAVNLDENNRCKNCGFKINVTGKIASDFEYREIQPIY